MKGRRRRARSTALIALAASGLVLVPAAIGAEIRHYEAVGGDVNGAKSTIGFNTVKTSEKVVLKNFTVENLDLSCHTAGMHIKLDFAVPESVTLGNRNRFEMEGDTGKVHYFVEGRVDSASANGGLSATYRTVVNGTERTCHGQTGWRVPAKYKPRPPQLTMKLTADGLKGKVLTEDPRCRKDRIVSVVAEAGDSGAVKLGTTRAEKPGGWEFQTKIAPGTVYRAHIEKFKDEDRYLRCPGGTAEAISPP
jgi:hypothetical protein